MNSDTSEISAITPNSVKFQPGHYGRIIHDPTRNADGVKGAQDWLKEPGFKTHMKGFHLFVNWATIEPTRGNFSWTAVDKVLALCSTEKLYLMVTVMDTNFQSMNPSGIVPPDVPTFVTKNGGVCAKRWLALWSMRYAEVLGALGKKYSTNLRLVSAGTPESALPITWTDIAPNVGDAQDMYREALLAAYRKIVPEMGHTAFHIGINFPDTHAFQDPIFGFARANHGCMIFWPDPLLKEPNVLWYQLVRQNAGAIGVFGGAQTHHIGPNDTRAVIDFYVDDLKTHYISHNHQYPGVSDYKARVIAGVNAENGKIVKIAPTGIAPVYTG